MSWLTGTLVSGKMVAENLKSLTFRVHGWPGHKAGQHCDIRLTAPNGYQAERSYSIANAPCTNPSGADSDLVEFGVQLLENGEVSPYLFAMASGEQIEIKGPLGGHFVWNTSMPGPLVLIAGGSGMVPLMSMILEYVAKQDGEGAPKMAGSAEPFSGPANVTLILSARRLELIPYYQELEYYRERQPNLKIIYTLTDVSPKDWKGYIKRIDQDLLKENLNGLMDKMPMIYICGPTGFVEATANNLVAIGFNPHEIKTERFG